MSMALLMDSSVTLEAGPARKQQLCPLCGPASGREELRAYVPSGLDLDLFSSGFLYTYI